eukprot:25466_1
MTHKSPNIRYVGRMISQEINDDLSEQPSRVLSHSEISLIPNIQRKRTQNKNDHQPILPSKPFLTFHLPYEYMNEPTQHLKAESDAMNAYKKFTPVQTIKQTLTAQQMSLRLQYQIVYNAVKSINTTVINIPKQQENINNYPQYPTKDTSIIEWPFNVSLTRWMIPSHLQTIKQTLTAQQMSLRLQYQIVYNAVKSINTTVINIPKQQENINNYPQYPTKDTSIIEWPFNVSLTRWMIPSHLQTKMTQPYPKISFKLLQKYIDLQSSTALSQNDLNDTCCIGHDENFIEQIGRHLFTDEALHDGDLNPEIDQVLHDLLNQLVNGEMCMDCTLLFCQKYFCDLFTLLHNICHEFESHYLTL